MATPATDSAATSPVPGAAGRVVRLSDSAARRIARLAELEGKPGLMLRLTVSGAGSIAIRARAP